VSCAASLSLLEHVDRYQSRQVTLDLARVTVDPLGDLEGMEFAPA